MRLWDLKRGENEDAPVVVLTTSKTTTSWVLAVLANTAVAGGDVSAVLASLAESGWHCLQKDSYVSVIRASTEPSTANTTPNNVQQHPAIVVVTLASVGSDFE